MLAAPFASKASVMSCVAATGAAASVTVTVAVCAVLFPSLSITVNVIVLAPRSLQLNVVCDKLMLDTLQFSRT